MIHDEQELDREIRKTLQAVTVPVGAKENLLLHLMAESEKQSAGLQATVGGSLDVEALGKTVCSVSEAVQPSSVITPSKSMLRNRHRYQWMAFVSVALIALVAFAFWPAATTTRLDVFMARHIERIENEPIQWDATVQLPASLQKIMAQVTQLQPLGFADITPKGSLAHIHVYAFRNQEGKQVLLIDMAKPKVRQQFGTQLTPLNSNTGGWSCAAAEVQGGLVVLAVPGNRAYLLKHLRNITVT